MIGTRRGNGRPPAGAGTAVPRTERPGDFTLTPAVLRLAPLALLIGALAAGAALALIDMIGFVTNLAYYQRIGVGLVSPAANTLGAAAVLVPVAGGLVVGLIARFGSPQVRGHGIPEAMESILAHGSRVQPRLALLKPLASAIGIGTGGPFGAEGPIIVTGGAFGSIVGQLVHLTAAQRRTLLVAGAAAGMSAVFGTPVAATLFGVELLAFELRPRSTVLIAIAAATADALRIVMAHGGLLPPQPLFPVPAHAPIAGAALLGAAGIGLAVGLSAWLMTQAVYRSEDLFARIGHRVHWMWWPMLGGLVIGLGGLLQPRALGVGYDTIHAELLGELGLGVLVSLFAVKLVIWSVGLGSGSSGGILAPTLMMGAAIGGILGHALPGASVGAWSLIGMAAGLAGVTGAPFTAIIFAFELTHDANSLLALLVAASIAYLVAVLLLKRSILTERIARRGLHVMREYAVDPLEAASVGEVMRTGICRLAPEDPPAVAVGGVGGGPGQRLYPVVDGHGRLVGVVPRAALRVTDAAGRIGERMITPVAVAHPDEILRVAADRMAAAGVGAVPVVGRDGRLAGLLTESDLLAARRRLLAEESDAERVLRVGGRRGRRNGAVPDPVETDDGHGDPRRARRGPSPA